MNQHKTTVKAILLRAYALNSSCYSKAVEQMSRELLLFRFRPNIENLTKEIVTETISKFTDEIASIIKSNGDSKHNISDEDKEILYNFLLHRLTGGEDNVEKKDWINFRKFLDKHIKSPGSHAKAQAMEIKNKQSYDFPYVYKYSKWMKDWLNLSDSIEHKESLVLQGNESIKEILSGLQRYALELIDAIKSNSNQEEFNKKQTLILLLQSLIRISSNVIYDNHKLNGYTLPDFISTGSIDLAGGTYTEAEQQQAISLQDWCMLIKQIESEIKRIELDIQKELPDYYLVREFEQVLDKNSKYILQIIKLLKLFSSMPTVSLPNLPIDSGVGTKQELNEQITDFSIGSESSDQIDSSKQTAKLYQQSVTVVDMNGENVHTFLINKNIIDKLGFYTLLLQNPWLDRDNLECITENLGVINSDNQQSLLLNFFEILANGKIKYAVKLKDLIDLNQLFKYFGLEDELLQQSIFEYYMLAYINANDIEAIFKDLKFSYDKQQKRVSYQNYFIAYCPTYQDKIATYTVAKNFIATLPKILDKFDVREKIKIDRWINTF